MLGVGIDELLSSPSMQGTEAGSDHDLRQQLDASSKVGDELISLLNAQLANIRALDRQMGATIVGNEVEVKADQVAQLIKYSLSDRIRRLLARLLSELHTLAGWQSLDQGRVMKSWQHYETAKSAALESCAPAFEAYATAEQAFVLLDINETNSALDLLVAARRIADAKCSPMLRSWMAAAHGEALAAFGNRAESLRAFDKAAALLPVDIADLDGPYVTLDPVHLARWRGHALARFADPDAVDVLTSALDRLDPTFTRAEAALRVDLAVVLSALNESVEANIQANRARSLAVQVGSFRQTMRLTSLIPCVQANGS
jgi:tetratricopeptide (TPR) repeat protein